MPSLTTAELRKMPFEDLSREVRDMRRAVTKERLDLEVGKSKASHKYRLKKREIARALTILAEKGDEAVAKKGKR